MLGIDFDIINCSEDMTEADRLNLTETPTLIDPNGKMFTGANAVADWLKYNSLKNQQTSTNFFISLRTYKYLVYYINV